MLSSIISVLFLATVVLAKTISIQVAKGGLNFMPNSTAADVGDLLEFHFYSFAAPHSVVEGTFEQPCMSAPDAFFSYYIDGSTTGNETYSIMVTSTNPIWFYCSAHMHCQNGMGGVVNPPANMTLAMYAAAAKQAASNVAPASTMISGSYTTIPATMTSALSSIFGNLSMSMTGTSTPTTGTTATGTGSGSVSTTSTGGGAMRTAGVLGMMAAGGLAALMV